MDQPIRVFLSSTWQGLHLEREAVEKVLHAVQQTTLTGLQYFGSRLDTLSEISLAEVERSDVYIGMFAHRYGSGITEAEYRTAQEQDIPCLIYFKDESVPVVLAHIEHNPEKKAKLEALKRELSERHTVSFFTSPDSLVALVVANLSDLLASMSASSSPLEQSEEKEEATSKSSYTTYIFNSQGVALGDKSQVIMGAEESAATDGSLLPQWPANVPNMRYYRLPSRERELERLLNVLDAPQGMPVVVIDGLGGLGKTALAAELARRALERQMFDGFVGDSAKQELLAGGEIIQMNQATLDFDSFLDSMARQLGRWELLTRKPEEKRAALAHLLRQDRYLLLVDNLETAENANALVANLHGLLDGSRAIITTRKKVRHDFVRSLSLQGLDVEDSLFFLRTDAQQRSVQQIFAVPEKKLIEVHQITGGAPLALKLVVAQARFLNLDSILKQLGQAKGSLYPFIFLQSWQQLSPAAQKILIYIGRTVVTTVSWEELAFDDMIPQEEELSKAIEQLVKYSLLDVYFRSGQPRYGIHQLTRQFVTNDLPRIWREQGLLL